MNNEQKIYDVVIVGAGYAGLYLAQLLSQQYSVCLVEKKKDLVGELNTTGSTLFNQKDDIFTLFNIPEELILTKYSSISIQSKINKVTTEKNMFPWVLLDIPALKKYLVNNIHKSAYIMKGSEVIDIIKHKDSYEGVTVQNIDTREEVQIKGKMIVDASGSSDALATKTHMRIPRFKSQCYQVDADIDIDFDDSHVQTFMGHPFCEKGYAYIFPISKKRVRIGTNSIYSLTGNKAGIEDLFADFLRYLNATPTNIDNEVKIEVYTGGVNINNSKNNLLIIGDAAGYISPFVGEGIRFAFHSADIASKLVASYLESGNKSSLEQFYSQWEKRFGRTFKLSYYLQYILLHINDNLIDSFVYKLQKVSRKHPLLLFKFIATKNTFIDFVRIIV